MASKKQGAGVGIAAVLVAITGLVGASEGGFLNINYTNIDSHDQNIFTSIINQFGLDITPEELEIMCGNPEELEDPFRTACNVINRNTGG
jgi:hypothetical protein